MAFVLLAIGIYIGSMISEAARPEAPYRAPASAADLDRLMSKINVRDIMEPVYANVRENNPNLTDADIAAMKAAMNETEFKKMVRPVYERHLSYDDIRSIADFYESPAGQRFVGKMPALMSDALAIGREYGKLIGARAVAIRNSQAATEPQRYAEAFWATFAKEHPAVDGHKLWGEAIQEAGQDQPRASSIFHAKVQAAEAAMRSSTR